MNNKLTLGGISPESILWLLPAEPMLWWKPCLTRAEGSMQPHCWYLSWTTDGTSYCHVCRVGRPRVYVGPKERVAAIKAAMASGDHELARRLAWGNAPLPQHEEPSEPTPWRPAYRDRADWLEWWKERASIFEYLGGMSRAEAEIAATELAGTWNQ